MLDQNDLAARHGGGQVLAEGDLWAESRAFSGGRCLRADEVGHVRRQDSFAGLEVVRSPLPDHVRLASEEENEGALVLSRQMPSQRHEAEGPGHYRGGVGIMRVLRVVGGEVRLTLSSDRATVAPWGLFGGLDATPSKCDVVAPDGNIERLPSKVTTSVMQDHVIYTETPGGGGWGVAPETSSQP